MPTYTMKPNQPLQIFLSKADSLKPDTAYEARIEDATGTSTEQLTTDDKGDAVISHNASGASVRFVLLEPAEERVFVLEPTDVDEEKPVKVKEEKA